MQSDTITNAEVEEILANPNANFDLEVRLARALNEAMRLVRRLVTYIPLPPTLPICEVDRRQADAAIRDYFGDGWERSTNR